jgi:hypothetical protein
VYYSSESREADQWGVPDEQPRSGRGAPGGHLDRRTVAGLVAATLVVAALLVGLRLWDAHTASQLATGDCAIGVDLTSLVNDPSTPIDETETYRNQYLDWTTQILGNCIDDGAVHLTVFAIAGDTVSQDRARVVGTFPRFDTGSDRGRQEDERRQWIDDEAKPKVEALLDGGLGGVAGTDVISAVSVADDVLQDDVDFRRIWLLTDGVHNAGYGINVRLLDGRDGARAAVDGLVAGEHLVPGMLSGVEVHMLGVGGGGPSANITEVEATRMQLFWEELFDTAGAQLEYSSGGPDL